MRAPGARALTRAAPPCPARPRQAGALPLPEGLAAWSNLGALLLYVGCYQLSFGPISWLLVGEVFPLKIR